MIEDNESKNSVDTLFTKIKLFAYIGIAIFGLVMLTYFINFGIWPPKFSTATSDWSAFGSLLAGASSILGAIGTVGVLMISIKQFEIHQKQLNEQQQYIKKQDSLIDSELFEKHKNNFTSVLQQIENRFNNKFKFKDKDHLYTLFFPKNRFRLESKKIQKDANVETIIELISSVISIKKTDVNYLGRLVTATNQVMKTLAGTKSLAPGDILLNGSNVGVNIFKPQETSHFLIHFIHKLNNFCSYGFLDSALNLEKNNTDKVNFYEDYLKISNESSNIDLYFKCYFETKEKLAHLKFIFILIENSVYKNQYNSLILEGVNVQSSTDISNFVSKLMDLSTSLKAAPHNLLQDAIYEYIEAMSMRDN